MMWQAPPDPLNLVGTAIHVWRVDLCVSAASFQYLEVPLSPDERTRAARFRFDEPRKRFVVARGVLRDVLSRYVDQPADALRFTYNAYGKPSLLNHDWLQFNLSHSGEAPASSAGVALIAVTRRRPIGVDVERIAPPDTMERLVEQFFSTAEKAAFRALPEDQRTAAFYAGWTRKEAYIKALGVGASLPLDQFDVTMSPNESARLMADRVNPGNVDRWSLLNLDPGPGYVAALAVENPLGPVECYEWERGRIVD